MSVPAAATVVREAPSHKLAGTSSETGPTNPVLTAMPTNVPLAKTASSNPTLKPALPSGMVATAGVAAAAAAGASGAGVSIAKAAATFNSYEMSDHDGESSESESDEDDDDQPRRRKPGKKVRFKHRRSFFSIFKKVCMVMGSVSDAE